MTFERMIHKLIILFVLLGSMVSCGKQQVGDIKEYDGPITESDDVTTFISDSTRLKLIIRGKKHLTFTNGDSEYPQGVFLEFYDKDGSMTSTLKANRAFYSKKTDEYKVEEDVEVYNIENKERLNSEELFWNPKKEEIHTNKFVSITTPTQVIKGVGLTAKQDFSSYVIRKVTGIISVEEDVEQPTAD